MAILHSSQAQQFTRNKNKLKQWIENVTVLLGCAIFSIKIPAAVIKLHLEATTCDPKVAPFRQKHQLNIKGSNQPYLAGSLSSWVVDYSFSFGGSQGHQLVLKICPAVFYIYIKSVTHAFFSLSILSYEFLSLSPSSPSCSFRSWDY